MVDALTTREVADRLGVKPETVYAYVSRGLLTSRPAASGRGSLFDIKEVDALLRRRGRRQPPLSGPHVVAGDTDVATGVTLITGDRHYYRGVDALSLAEQYSFEEVADWLWTGTWAPGRRFPFSGDVVTTARRAIAALPAHSGLIDQLRVATVAAATSDPLRFDLTNDSVEMAARTLVTTMVHALAGPSATPGETSIAGALWAGLSSRAPDQTLIRCIDAALILAIDHDLAASTLAARVAASARANPYAVVSAALGALEGPLHGAASALAHRMLADALERGSAQAVVAELLREQRRIPGLGHRIYASEDPRATFLLSVLDDLPVADDAVRMARDIVDTVTRSGRQLFANIDLALAALTVSAGMAPEAGETMFAVARTAGWVAHALEEYREQPMRMRPSGRYVGPRPPQPLPLSPDRPH